MKKHMCDQCKLRAKYDKSPKSFYRLVLAMAY